MLPNVIHIYLALRQQCGGNVHRSHALHFELLLNPWLKTEKKSNCLLVNDNYHANQRLNYVIWRRPRHSMPHVASHKWRHVWHNRHVSIIWHVLSSLAYVASLTKLFLSSWTRWLWWVLDIEIGPLRVTTMIHPNVSIYTHKVSFSKMTLYKCPWLFARRGKPNINNLFLCYFLTTNTHK